MILSGRTPHAPGVPTRERARALCASAATAGLLLAALAALCLPATASAVIFRPFECKVKKATIVGTDQDDVLEGTNKDDVIVGLGGNDRVTGGGGEDRICGGDGDDTLDGGPKDDKLSGDAGNDTLLGEQGWDDVFGDEGNDTLVEPSDDRGTNALSGGPGIDDIEGGRGEDGIDGGDDGDKIKAGGGDDDVDGDDGDDDIDGGPGNDDIDGGGGKDIIKGAGAADQRLTGGGEDDIIDGGPGDDRHVFGLDGADVLDGAGGDDRLNAGNGNDRLEGGPGKDEMIAGAGVDKCGGGAARDVCDGGAPSPSNRNNDPDVCTEDVEKQVDCREGFPVAWSGTAIGEISRGGSARETYSYSLAFEAGPGPLRGGGGGGGAFYSLQSGTVDWQISGNDGECSHSGSGTASGLTGEMEIDSKEYRFTIDEDAAESSGSLTTSCPPGTDACPDGCSSTEPFEYFLIVDTPPRPWSPEMTRLTGSAQDDGSGVPFDTLTWDFSAAQ